MEVPKICVHYNFENGCRNQQDGKRCPFLHICKHYIMDHCKFGQNCKRNHDIDAEVKEILTRCGINVRRPIRDLIAELRSVLSQSENDIRSETREVFDQRPRITASSSVFPRPRTTFPTSDPQRSMMTTPNWAMQNMSLNPNLNSFVNDSAGFSSMPTSGAYGGARTKMSMSGKQLSVDSTQGTQICLYNLRGKCCFRDSCKYEHKNMPYQWQIRYQSDSVWEDLEEQNNLDVELEFCNPGHDECVYVDRADVPIRIFFEKMEAKIGDNKNLEVRRLSTISSEDAVNQPLATRWCWFWLDQSGKWTKYGSKDSAGYQSKLDSDGIEQRYLANPKGQYQFETQGYKYIMDFTMMSQHNVETQVKRRVKRRPEFVNKLEAERKKHQSVQSGAGIGIQPCSVPSTWDVQHGKNIIDIYNRVKVKNLGLNRQEYGKVETLFMESMPKTTSIISIERIENGELWTNYNIKKVKMQRKNPSLKELYLFHGTQVQYVDAICHQGFDFRLGGQSTGARLGKGSYFAKNASYADRYTEHGNCTIFLVRVLVGDYTLGDKTYTRPPLKDPRNPCSDLYDSCVDDVNIPKIYVIFENCQVYPDYIIEYKMN